MLAMILAFSGLHRKRRSHKEDSDPLVDALSNRGNRQKLWGASALALLHGISVVTTPTFAAASATATSRVGWLIAAAVSAFTYSITDASGSLMTGTAGIDVSERLRQQAVRHAQEESDDTNPLDDDLHEAAVLAADRIEDVILNKGRHLATDITNLVTAAVLPTLLLGYMGPGATASSVMSLTIGAAAPVLASLAVGVRRAFSSDDYNGDLQRASGRQATGLRRMSWRLLDFLRPLNGDIAMKEACLQDIEMRKDAKKSLFHHGLKTVLSLDGFGHLSWLIPVGMATVGLVSASPLMLPIIVGTALGVQPAVRRMGATWAALVNARGANEFIMQYLRKHSDLKDDKDARPLERTDHVLGIRLSGVGRILGGRRILEDADGVIPTSPGHTMVTGPSGSGKSTMLRMITGWLRPTSGVVSLIVREGALGSTEKPLTAFTKRSLYRLWSIAPQQVEAKLLTVGELMAMAAPKLLNGDSDTRRDLLSCLHGFALEVPSADLDDFLMRPLGRLSEGEQRRVLNAMVGLDVRTKKRLVAFFDEPTDGLDAPQRDTVLRYIDEMSTSVRVVTITHELRAAESLGASLIMLGKKPGEIRGPTTIVATVPDARVGAPLAYRIGVESDLERTEPWPAAWRVESREASRHGDILVRVAGYKEGNRPPHQFSYRGPFYTAGRVADAIDKWLSDKRHDVHKLPEVRPPSAQHYSYSYDLSTQYGPDIAGPYAAYAETLRSMDPDTVVVFTPNSELPKWPGFVDELRKGLRNPTALIELADGPSRPGIAD